MKKYNDRCDKLESSPAVRVNIFQHSKVQWIKSSLQHCARKRAQFMIPLQSSLPKREKKNREMLRKMGKI